MIAEGAFVKTLFPTREELRRPGLLSICYCFALARPLALVAYTSSRPWPTTMPLPPGVRIFGAAEAARLNQRPFVLYLDRLAKVPLSAAWFPEIAEPSQGVIAVAPEQLRDELMHGMAELLQRRRGLVHTPGP